VKAADLRHRAVIQKNIGTYDIAVAKGRARFADWQNARSHAAAIKWETINHLDRYLEQFEQNVLANGGHVFWAETAEDARGTCWNWPVVTVSRRSLNPNR
jgi:L-lactate dehydrogenase complex protein LldF